MKKYCAIMLFATLLVCSWAAVAQETTGGIQGTVKDPSGAVVLGASVEVSGPALIGKKTATTDQGGYFRFVNLPPGTYNLVITAANFRTFKQPGIRLEVGASPSVNATLQVGQAAETVEVSAEAEVVDITASKVQTNVTREILDSIPKGREYKSLIQFAPGARSEPLQGSLGNSAGIQIDGASNSENAYLVEGQETAHVINGQSNANVPTDFIQEVQVKSSGFEAEFGGALGGVVNVIQKRGSNTAHGSVFTYYRGDQFDAGPVKLSRLNPDTVQNVLTRLDQTQQFVQPKKDRYRIVEPGFEVGGALWKDRVWGFAAFVPQIFRLDRTVNMNYVPVGGSPTVGPFTFRQTAETYNSLARLDVLATQRIRLFGSWQYGYARGAGQTAGAGATGNIGSILPFTDYVGGERNTSATSNPLNFGNQQGFVSPNVVYNTGADITLTSNLVATTRFGYFYSDAEDRGIPTGLRYRYVNSNYAYGGVGTNATTKALDNTLLSSIQGGRFVQTSGYGNIGANLTQLFDKTSRTSLGGDLAWFKKAFGTHNLKGGVAWNKLHDNVNLGYNSADIYVAYTRPYSVLPSNQNVCAAIRAQNLTAYGTTGSASNSSCQGLWGTYNLREFGTLGNEASNNHALYIQDSWTPGHGLTLNLGVRFDKEDLPSFNNSSGFKGIHFGFGDKIAPRFGGAYDVLHNGKLKLYASYGVFFDIMKYNLPRGSFGGDYWHDCVYTLDTPDWTTIVPQRVNGGSGHYCPLTGTASGTTPGRFIENKDFREPSNDPSNYLVDPNLKPMRQHETVVGLDWMATNMWAVETRYSRKRLDRTIEDAGIITPLGEQYYIVNPGERINLQPVAATDCTGCPNQPKAVRNYDGLEVRLTRRGSGKWFGTLSYTYSRLYGNYSGLTATDTSDGGGARQGANTDRAFDEPYMQYDAHGNLINGPLGTDRPHTFKAFGYYRVKWHGMETLLGMTQLAYQGTPLSTFLSADGAPVFVEGRGNYINVTRDPATGDLVAGTIQHNKRTSPFTQTDLNFIHEMHISKTNEALKVGIEANITNLLNQKQVLLSQTNLFAAGNSITLPGAPATSISGVNYKAYMTGYNYIQASNTDGVVLNGQYGQPTTWQPGRTIRFKFKFTF